MSSRKYLIRRVLVIVIALAVVGAGLFFVLQPDAPSSVEVNQFYPLALEIEDATTFDITFINSNGLGILGVFIFIPNDLTPEEFAENMQTMIHVIGGVDFEMAAVRFVLLGEYPTYGLSPSNEVEELQSVATFMQIQILGSDVDAYYSEELSWEQLQQQALVREDFGFIGDTLVLSWVGE